jgi:hypothetical protein
VQVKGWEEWRGRGGEERGEARGGGVGGTILELLQQNYNFYPINNTKYMIIFDIIYHICLSIYN